jgi:hypothetical protein
MMNFGFVPIYLFATSDSKNDESILIPMITVMGIILNICWIYGSLADELQVCLFPLNLIAFIWASYKTSDSFHFKYKLFYALLAIAITLVTFVPGLLYYGSWIIRGIMLVVAFLSLSFPVAIILEMYRLLRVIRRKKN